MQDEIGLKGPLETRARSLSEKSAAALRAAAYALCLYHVLLLVCLLARAIFSDSMIEPNEGLMLEHVQRLASGKKLYPGPSLEWIPILYPPLFSYAAWLASQVLGMKLACLRVVSWLSVSGSLLLIYRGVRARASDALPALAAVALFCATYFLGDCFLGNGRVDSLFVFLLLATWSFFERAERRRDYLAAGALAALTLLCKQTAAPILMALFAASLFIRGRSTLAVLPAFALVCGTGLLWINHHDSEGSWLYFYLVQLPAAQPRSIDDGLAFLRGERNGAIFPLLVLAMACLGPLVARGREKNGWLLSALLASALFMGVLGDMKAGGDRNHYIPMYAALALCLGHLGATLPSSPASLRRQAWVAFTLVQLALLLYRPTVTIELERSYAAPAAVREQLSQAGPDTVVLTHYSYLARGRSFPIANFQAFADLFSVPADRPELAAVRAQLDALLAAPGPRTFIVSQWAFGLASSEEEFRRLHPCREIAPAASPSPVGYTITGTSLCQTSLR